MKVRDSGMPQEEMWSEFFDAQVILEQMQLTSELENVVDLGSVTVLFPFRRHRS